MVGMLTRAAAMRRPGTFLSQLGIITSPSNWWATAIHSVASAMRSRVTREYFMPVWPMAMPSQTAMAGNSMGVPPAIRMPALTASAIRSSSRCPGTISLKELTTPTRGRDSSSAVRPRA